MFKGKHLEPGASANQRVFFKMTCGYHCNEQSKICHLVRCFCCNGCDPSCQQPVLKTNLIDTVNTRI